MLVRWPWLPESWRLGRILNESMTAKLEEVEFTYQQEKVRFDEDAAILDCHLDGTGRVAVKTGCRINDFNRGLSYRFYGVWVEHPRYGRQFHAKTFVRVQPHDRTGTIRYLMLIPNIGRTIAQALWDKLGGDAVKILREQPDVASAAVGRVLSLKRATEASAFLQQQKQIEDATIDLMDLLAGYGFPKTTPKDAIEEWGNRAAELLKRNPFLLGRFPGCGFLLCDRLYLDLGGDPARRKRQALCAWDVLHRDTSGSTWYRPAIVERGLKEKIGGARVEPVKALTLAKRAGIIATNRDDEGRLWLAEEKRAENEAAVASRVRYWLDGPTAWPSVTRLDVSLHQVEMLQKALVGPLAILTGGPGTGKTYSATRLVGATIDRHGRENVAVAAPTAKAAVRITEVLTGYGIKMRARTIHSLLGVTGHSRGGGWSFEHNEDNPLPFRFVFADEASMIDTDLAASLFRACGPGTHLVLVGDVGQLPPVGHGSLLRDLIIAGVPTGELTEIRRNSGQIVRACHDIWAGNQFQVNPRLNPAAGENLKLLPAANGKAALEQIVLTIRKLAMLVDPIRDCQVIVAVNAKSDLSRAAVNRRLQTELNPNGGTAGANPFRVGDKIVCLRNGFCRVVKDAPGGLNQEAVDGKVVVANGEQGIVKHVEPKLTIVQLESPARLIKIPRGSSESEGDGEESNTTGCQWDLAYAISCHKSQGSEWPWVFVALDEYAGARMVCSREWLYTAISRAKFAGFLVGKLDCAYGMMEREAIKRRKTFLVESILQLRRD